MLEVQKDSQVCPHWYVRNWLKLQIKRESQGALIWWSTVNHNSWFTVYTHTQTQMKSVHTVSQHTAVKARKETVLQLYRQLTRVWSCIRIFAQIWGLPQYWILFPPRWNMIRILIGHGMSSAVDQIPSFRTWMDRFVTFCCEIALPDLLSSGMCV